MSSRRGWERDVFVCALSTHDVSARDALSRGDRRRSDMTCGRQCGDTYPATKRQPEGFSPWTLQLLCVLVQWLLTGTPALTNLLPSSEAVRPGFSSLSSAARRSSEVSIGKRSHQENDRRGTSLPAPRFAVFIPGAFTLRPRRMVSLECTRRGTPISYLISVESVPADVLPIANQQSCGSG